MSCIHKMVSVMAYDSYGFQMSEHNECSHCCITEDQLKIIELEARIQELEDRPDHGMLEGVKLPAWMWCEEWNRKAYVIGKGMASVQYAEMSNGNVSYLPIDSLRPLKNTES